MPTSWRLLLVPVLLALLAACARKGEAAKKGSAGPRPAPVEVAKATLETVPLQVRAIGNMEEYRRVEVRPQVTGQLQRVHFREGQDVRQGDLLFQIDPRTFQAAVREAQATVAQAQAAVKEAEAGAERAAAEARQARSQYDRFAGLAAKGIISRLQGEQYRTTAEAAERTADAARAGIESAKANVGAAEAKLADARVQLSYTTLRAPISGRTGGLTVREGNLVTANSTTPLVVINQVTPIYATFSVPEQALANVRRFSGGRTLAVEAVPADNPGPPAVGTLEFIDNEVDQQSGTIRLKATFANRDRRLWPGQFVNTLITLTQEQSIVVPSRAVQRGQKGDYVFVVQPDMTAHQRYIRATRTFGDKTLLTQGVRPGETVVVDGQVAVKPGGKVTVGGRERQRPETPKPGQQEAP